MPPQAEDDFIEGEFVFDFAGRGRRFDRDGIGAPSGMKRVDFIVREDERLLLVEVKDPCDQRAPESERKKWSDPKYWSGEIVDRLVPKVRSTYLHLHLMEEDGSPCTYVVVAGLDQLGVGPEFSLLLTEELKRRVRMEAGHTWRRSYLSAVAVVDIDTFNNSFAPYSVTRQP